MLSEHELFKLIWQKKMKLFFTVIQIITRS